MRGELEICGWVRRADGAPVADAAPARDASVREFENAGAVLPPEVSKSVSRCLMRCRWRLL